MNGLKFYSMFEFPKNNEHFKHLNWDTEFPGMKQAVAGSIEYQTYEACTEAAIKFLKQKLKILNATEERIKVFGVEPNRYKIYFEKNQFNDTQSGWELNEVVKIYIADSFETVYNNVFQARVYFVKSLDDAATYFDAPTTLQ